MAHLVTQEIETILFYLPMYIVLNILNKQIS